MGVFLNPKGGRRGLAFELEDKKRKGKKQMSLPATETELSEKKILPVFLLCFFFGALGIHRFFVGKTGTAVLQILTLGGLGIWVAIDLILIIIGSFTDKEGKKITVWM